MRDPGQGSGSYGTASEFGSLDGWSLEEVDAYLSQHSELRRSSVNEAGYRHYIFDDQSEIWIRSNGEVIRIPHRLYDSAGKRIKGYRLSITGQILRTNHWHELPRPEQEWVVI